MNLNITSMDPDPTHVGEPIIDERIVTGRARCALYPGEGASVPLEIEATDMDFGFTLADSKDSRPAWPASRNPPQLHRAQGASIRYDRCSRAAQS